MEIKIKISDDYNGVRIHKRKNTSYSLLPGVTCLVGCNGYGKSTTSKEIRDWLTKNSYKYVDFDNTVHGGSFMKAKCVQSGDFKTLATFMESSEGESLIVSFGVYVEKISAALTKRIKDQKPLFVFLDAIDSGISIDNARNIRSFLFRVIEDANKNDISAFIIITANTFEMCRSDTLEPDQAAKFRCLDPYDFTHKSFGDYTEYEKYIIETRSIVSKRYDMMDKGEE